MDRSSWHTHLVNTTVRSIRPGKPGWGESSRPEQGLRAAAIIADVALGKILRERERDPRFARRYDEAEARAGTSSDS
jgi:hypothetical protein